MASINSYTTKSGETLWKVRYRKPGTNRSTDKSGFKRKKDAQDWSAVHTVEVMTGAYVDPLLGKTYLSDLAPAWLAKKQVTLAPSYFDDIEGAWGKYVEPRWGSSQVKSITKPDVQEWAVGLSVSFVNKRGESEPGKSATVIKRAVGILAGILDDAKDRRMVVENAARGIETPAKTPKKHVYLTATQLFKLADNVGDDRKLLILVFGLVGLRWGEAAGLRVRDVDTQRHRMRIWGSATQVGTTIVEGTTKGKKFRSVVYPKILDPLLAEQMKGKRPEDLLFTGNLDGGYIRQVSHPRTGSGWFGKACAAAGVPRMAVHDLRHTAASLMVKSGANVKAVQRQLGHSSAAMTLDIYSDLFDDDLDAVGSAMSDLLLRESVGFSWVSGVETVA